MYREKKVRKVNFNFSLELDKFFKLIKIFFNIIDEFRGVSRL